MHRSECDPQLAEQPVQALRPRDIDQHGLHGAECLHWHPGPAVHVKLSMSSEVPGNACGFGRAVNRSGLLFVLLRPHHPHILPCFLSKFKGTRRVAS